ncbi:MAG: hypothetical protein KF770_10660 [Anaerolineae bacterium]|nr:hypothetical protein [Anaerolineae bacterium]
MYHLHCTTCGLFLEATTDREQARGVYYCPEHAPAAVGAVPDFHPLLPGVGEEIAAALAAAGYGDVGRVRAASDSELLAISGIGPARLRKIREVLNEM